jgi:GNAT superfamily N-acetyltransferase
MLSDMYDMSDQEWKPIALAALRTGLDGPAPTLVAFVVDRPGGGLASCVVGVVQTRLGSPGNPDGRSGYVFSVSTDVDARRRGYARAAMEALLDWYRQQGITKIDLRASDDGGPLYESLGFVRDTQSMRLLAG